MGQAITSGVKPVEQKLVKFIPPAFACMPFYWTVEHYFKAVDTGVFTEEDKIELLFGGIFRLMPSGSPHTYCITLITRFFQRRLGFDYQYREEKPLGLSDQLSAPEPDIAIVVDKDYSKNHPVGEDVFLVVEVAKSSLGLDREVKVQLYAAAELAEYWIVNLVDRQIEVHLNPLPQRRAYKSVAIYEEGNTFTSPFAGEVVVAELLPAAEEETTTEAK